MTDNEIIEALDGNILNAKSVDCKVWSLEVYKLENALNLINRQKAEIERLEKELMKCKLEKEMLHQTVSEIQTNTIKEFAERLKEYELCMFCSFPNNKSLGSEQYIVLSDSIDNLVKEMTEEIEK